MNESMVYQADRAVKLTDPVAPTIDDENERRYAEDGMRRFRVPVAVIRRGIVEVLARDAKSAEGLVSVCAALADDFENAEQSEVVGRAVAA
jgi:hypothetical protein